MKKDALIPYQDTDSQSIAFNDALDNASEEGKTEVPVSQDPKLQLDSKHDNTNHAHRNMYTTR